MSANEHPQDTNLATIWQGEGVLNEKDHLLCPLARFETLGVQTGDRIHVKSEHGEVAVGVLQVESEERLLLQDVAAVGGLFSLYGSTVLPSDEVRVEVTVTREVDKPCPICKRDGMVSEIDHVHCVWCRGKQDLDTKAKVCESCVKTARERLVRDGAFVEKMSILSGRRHITIHSRTLAESDGMQEWQDRMILENPKLTTQHVLTESAKALLAICLDDDGNGEKPSKWLVAGTPDDPHVKIPIIMKHFKGMHDAVYRAMLSALHRIDTLIEEACIYRIDDKFTEQDKMELAESIVTSSGEVLGQVTIFDGLERLTFAAVTTDLMDEANSFAEMFIQSNSGKMLEGRGQFILALARMAAVFRGDSRRQFSADSPFNDRLGYLMTLPLPLYYLYVAASNVWQRRVNAASEVEVLGNF